MSRQNIVSTKIYQLVFSLGLLSVMLSAVRTMMFGAKTSAIRLGAFLVGAGCVLAVDSYYWALAAFLYGFRETVPHVRFTGLELGSIIVIGTFFVRRALHKEATCRYNKFLLMAGLPFIAWMCLIWSQNPTGMLIFGSSTIGGRFYFKVIVAFLAMGCLSSIQLKQNDCKLLLATYLTGVLLHLLLRNSGSDTIADFQDGGTHYRIADFWFVAAYFLTRFSAFELLANGKLFIAFLVSFGLTIYSGNRHSAGSAMLACVLTPIMLRRDRARTGVLMIIAMIFLGILVIGHGRIWNLPFSIQRSFSFLPGKWDERLTNYGFKDAFRAQMREMAKDSIRSKPWFGNGGFALSFRDILWSSRSSLTFQEGMAFSRNWHNVWLGMAADFGIPFSVAWAFFMAVLLISGWKWVRSEPYRCWRQTAMAYFYLIILITFIDFWFNGGHSAKTPERIFIWAGMLCAAKNSVINDGETQER